MSRIGRFIKKSDKKSKGWEGWEHQFYKTQVIVSKVGDKWELEIIGKTFGGVSLYKTKKEALKNAYDYMKSHPRGNKK